MIYKNLLVQIVIRLVGILLLSFVAGFIYWETKFQLIAYLLLLVLIWFSYRLIHYLNATNRLLTQFFLSVKNDDISIKVPRNVKGKSFEELHKSMYEINQTIRDLRLQFQRKEMHSEAIIEHASIGLLSFNKDGIVGCINIKGRELLGIHNLINIKALLKIDEELVKLMMRIKPGETQVHNFQKNQINRYLLISCTSIVLTDVEFKLVSIADIKNEIDAKELESWQKLINVLTHEIMNSVSPLTCLSEKLENNYRKIEAGTILTESVLNKTRDGLQVIKEQGQGLMYFVEAYRELSRIPKPLLKSVSVAKLFLHLKELLNLESNEKIQFHFNVYPENLNVHADEILLKQVLINLIKNAQQAIHNEGEIKVNAEFEEDHFVKISIADTGCGITVEDLKNVFVPFYTTKEEGSGIGLSVARQIIRLHKGNIILKSDEQQGTTVSLLLKSKQI